MQSVKISSILGTKTFQNIFSTWLKIGDGNKRCFNLLFFKIYMAYLLFPSHLFNGLIPNLQRGCIYSCNQFTVQLDPKALQG